MKLAPLILAALLLLPAAAGAQPAALVEGGKAALPDAELAKLRGGFLLPGGLAVSLAVTTDTRVDGQLILRTIFTAADGTPNLRVFGRDAADAPRELSPSAGDLATRDGILRLRDLPAGARVELAGSDFDINHFVGQAFGSAVANTANGRTIDVVTTVDLDLANATPDLLGSSFFRVEAAALDATRQLVR